MFERPERLLFLAARAPDRLPAPDFAVRFWIFFALPRESALDPRTVFRSFLFFEVLRDRLSVYLGPNTTRAALKTFAHKTVGVAPEDLDARQARLVVEALRPMLKTLVGAEQCEHIVHQLCLELELRA